MSLLRKMVKEMAAAGSTSAHSIATVPGSLFGGGVVDANNPNPKNKNGKYIIRRLTGVNEGLGISSDETKFDAADVISKIDAAGKREQQADDTVPFGLEDDDGNIIKVYVRSEQSEEFEKELAAMLAGVDSDEDDSNTSLEIAEVLYELKDKYDIVNVEWPGIEGDVEEEQEAVGSADAGGMEQGGEQPPESVEDPANAGAQDELGDLGQDEQGQDNEPAMVPDDSAGESALNQVIDMMKADAEAKKAEADARAAEARAKEAEYSAQASAGRVRKEEQIFDMESAEKKQKEEEQEAQQLAKLARFQYQKTQDAESKLSMESEENTSDPWKTNDADEEDDELTMKELSALIMRNLRHN